MDQKSIRANGQFGQRLVVNFPRYFGRARSEYRRRCLAERAGAAAMGAPLHMFASPLALAKLKFGKRVALHD